MGICPIQWRKVFPWYWLHWQETIQIDTGIWYQNCCFYISQNKTASTYKLMLVQYKKYTGIVQNWQVRVVHFYIGTSVQIWCCYIILLNQLFCLTDFFTKQGDTHVAVYWCWYSTELILLVYQIIQSQCKTCHFLWVYYATWIAREWIKNTT